MEPTPYPPTNGETLRALRDSAGVSQDDVAALIGTTRQALGRWERNPRLSYVKAEKYRAAVADAVAAKVGRVA